MVISRQRILEKKVSLHQGADILLIHKVSKEGRVDHEYLYDTLHTVARFKLGYLHGYVTEIDCQRAKDFQFVQQQEAMAATAVAAQEYWGYLIRADKSPTPKFEQLLLGVANYIVSPYSLISCPSRNED